MQPSDFQIIETAIIRIFWLSILLGMFMGFCIYQPVVNTFYLLFRFIRRLIFRARKVR